MKKLVFLFAMVFAASMAMSQNNDATITQVGVDHEAIINQGGDLNDAFVVQTADAGREGFDLGDATVTQQGNNNLVNLKQRAFYGDATATIIQYGDDNKVHGTAANQAFYQNHGLNVVDVYMEGHRNTLYSLNSEAQKNINTFELDVTGNDNMIGMSQHFGLGDVDIVGDWNEVILEQQSGQPADEFDFNEATIDILGNWNVVNVEQHDVNNTAFVDIDGSSNIATIYQTGGQVHP